MTKRELRELIKSVIKEYTGTGDMASMGRTSDDGNNVTSPRPFDDDEDEIENYTDKNVYGSEGNHYRKDADPFNYNRPGAQSSGGPRFENKK